MTLRRYGRTGPFGGDTLTKFVGNLVGLLVAGLTVAGVVCAAAI